MFLMDNFPFVRVNNINKVLSFAYPKMSLYFNSFSLFSKSIWCSEHNVRRKTYETLIRFA